MPARDRSNPLALAVLISLHERPMHPYEVSTVLRERSQHETVRLNFGSLYAVVAALERRGHIVAEATTREGRRPERTVYALTETGRTEAREWLTSIISTPVNDFPAFGAGLSLLPALPPSEVVVLLRERAARLEHDLADALEARRANEASRVPRLVWVEDEYRASLLVAELAYVHRLADEIDEGSLDGIDWWRGIHEPASASSSHRATSSRVAT